MMFNTIEEYDNELTEINARLVNMEERMEKYPDRHWIKGNYNALKQIYDIILKDCEKFLDIMGDNANIHLDDSTKNNFSLPTISEIFEGINEFTGNISEALKSNMNINCENIIPIKKIRSGCFTCHLLWVMRRLTCVRSN